MIFGDENSPIAVLGVGNILLSDEGFGVRVVQHLVKWYDFTPQIRVIDGGTLGWDLLNFLQGVEKLILVDAIDGKAVPGTFFVLRDDEVKAYFKRKVSGHEAGIQEVLAWFEIKGKPIKNITVVGVQPLSLETGLELTPLIQSLVPKTVEEVIRELKKWGIEVKKREKARDLGTWELI
ncbi:MAG: hydrogenase HupD [Gammaproteobacteria bacterium]|nr:MAG: hydrogenase HupD [Gammaproteobacteria bacterium]RTZ68015.1 MAG: hydrogenase HupD [Aquificaceae bacterium]